MNGDLLNEGWKMKISQWELTVNGGQLPPKAYRFVTIFSSIFQFPATCLTQWANINGLGLGTD